MGLFSGLLLLPLAPVRGVAWLGEQLLSQADRETSDPSWVYQALADVDDARAAGEITPAEAAEAEEALVAQLVQVSDGYGRPWGHPGQSTASEVTTQRRADP